MLLDKIEEFRKQVDASTADEFKILCQRIDDELKDVDVRVNTEVGDALIQLFQMIMQSKDFNKIGVFHKSKMIDKILIYANDKSSTGKWHMGGYVGV